MLGDYGATGYGLYWRIVEMLHSNENHALSKEKYIYIALSCQMSTPVEQIEQFVKDCLMFINFLKVMIIVSSQIGF